MYIPKLVLILLGLVFLTLCATCVAFYCRLRVFHKIILKLEGVDERSDDSKWGDVEGMG